MDHRTGRRTRRPAVPHPSGSTAEPLHGRTTRRQAHRDAAADCPALHTKRVTPRVLRHTAAMLWRAKEVDIAAIALLLGHESTQTTHIYEHADPALKEEAIARTAPLGIKPGRYRPSDALLAFLEDL
jgi:integrase/recombinase XerD